MLLCVCVRERERKRERERGGGGSAADLYQRFSRPTSYCSAVLVGWWVLSDNVIISFGK